MRIVIAKTQKEIADNFLVRGKVFIIGQNIDWDIEFDGLDDEAILFTAYEAKKPVGAARLYKNKVGRVAVLEEYRGKGIGMALMQKIEEYAKNHAFDKLILHAQLYVKGFYDKLGYNAHGEIFQEADIDHIEMEKSIK